MGGDSRGHEVDLFIVRPGALLPSHVSMQVLTHHGFPTFAAVRQEQGQDAVEEACEGLVLLHEQGNRSARYWCCPTCDQKFHSGREFLAHVELAHEEVAVQVGRSWHAHVL